MRSAASSAGTGVSPLELVEAMITRIEQINPSLNAVVTPSHTEARS